MFLFCSRVIEAHVKATVFYCTLISLKYNYNSFAEHKIFINLYNSMIFFFFFFLGGGGGAGHLCINCEKRRCPETLTMEYDNKHAIYNVKK